MIEKNQPFWYFSNLPDSIYLVTRKNISQKDTAFYKKYFTTDTSSIHHHSHKLVLGHIYNMKNQFWAGLDSRASMYCEKKFGADY